jgi:methylthioribulose-1-phosphate dehydratase
MKQTLTRIIHGFHAKGWTPATSSNFSFRAAQGFWITGSGLDKGELDSRDFVLVQVAADGTWQARGGKPSAETTLHAWVYAHFPQARCVFHVHPPQLTVLSLLSAETVQFQGLELIKGIEGHTSHEEVLSLPVVPNAQDMTALAARLNPAGMDHGFLVAGHGLYAWGNSPQAAQRHVETFEFLADCALKLGLYGHTLDS